MPFTDPVPHMGPVSPTAALDDSARILDDLARSEPATTPEEAQRKVDLILDRAKSILDVTRAYILNYEDKHWNGSAMKTLGMKIRNLQESNERLKTQLYDAQANFRSAIDLVRDLEIGMDALTEANAENSRKRDAALLAARRYKRLARGKRPAIRKTARSKSPVEFLTCPVCLDAPRSIILTPCHHVALCESCLKLMKDNASASLKCPLCRTTIHSAAKIFF